MKKIKEFLKTRIMEDKEGFGKIMHKLNQCMMEYEEYCMRTIVQEKEKVLNYSAQLNQYKAYHTDALVYFDHDSFIDQLKKIPPCTEDRFVGNPLETQAKIDEFRAGEQQRGIIKNYVRTYEFYMKEMCQDWYDRYQTAMEIVQENNVSIEDFLSSPEAHKQIQRRRFGNIQDLLEHIKKRNRSAEDFAKAAAKLIPGYKKIASGLSEEMYQIYQSIFD